jgi:asparagine synthetase B (glutamine-hydrolysing)
VCGLIAWIGAVPADVSEMAKLSGARGAHQHGFVSISDSITKRAGSGSLAAPFVGSFTIGHSRLATSGAYSGTLPDPQEAQPYVQNDLVIAHNGVIETTKKTSHKVDTLVLFEVSDPHKFLKAHHETLKQNHALITANYNGMIISSFGQPLFYRQDENGLAVSSVPTRTGNWQRVIDTIAFDKTGAKL